MFLFLGGDKGEAIYDREGKQCVIGGRKGDGCTTSPTNDSSDTGYSGNTRFGCCALFIGMQHGGPMR